MRLGRWASAAACAAATVVICTGTGAHAATAWAPAATATIHPGIQTYTAGSQCTSNFVFSDGASTYLGQAAHCAGTGGNTETDGCTASSLPLGTVVEDADGWRIGTITYSSWLTMQSVHESNADACAYNDLALIRVDDARVAEVNPSVPHFGGPTGLRTASLSTGATVYTYGNSSLRLGLTQLSPKQGVSTGDLGNGWTHSVYTVTPGIPGDSGSGLLDAAGQAAGVLSTVALAPFPGQNNFGDLAKELAYASAHGVSASLVPGTQGFRASLL